MCVGKVTVKPLLAIAAAAAVALCPAAATSTTLYAKPAVTGAGECSSWTDACTLQTALNLATDGDEIWVMAGTHSPGSNREDTFQLVSGVAVYGGFDGTETVLSQRDYEANVTVLSGGENNYHVVTGSGTDATAMLDGFTVSGGNADGLDPYDRGAGMYNDAGSSTLTDVTFSGNSASQFGGGLYNENGSPTLTKITFSGNSASLYGGGMYSMGGSPTLTDVTFSGNSTSQYGGGIFNILCSPTLKNVTLTANSADEGGGMYNRLYSSPTLDNVTLTGNSASLYGGGIANYSSNPTLNNVTLTDNAAGTGGAMYNYSSDPVLNNVILWGDTAVDEGPEIYNTSSSPIVTDSVVEGGCPMGSSCTNVMTPDPLLGPLADNGGFTRTHALRVGSSAVDAGGVNSSCEATDQRGVPRPQGAGCDIGAYELAEPADLALALDVSHSPSLTQVDVLLQTDMVNFGPGQADLTTVELVVDPDLIIIDASSSQGSCVAASQTVTCSLGSLASSASATTIVTVQGTSGGVFTAAAEVSSPMDDPDPADNNSSAALTVVDPLECDAADNDANPTPDDIAPMVELIFGAAALGPADCDDSGTVDARDLALVIALSQP